MPKLVSSTGVALSEPSQWDDTNFAIVKIVGVPTPLGAPAGVTASPVYRIGTTGQTRQLYLIGGDLQSKIIPGQNGLSIRDNTDSYDNLLIDGAGDVTVRGNLVVPTGAIGLGSVLGAGTTVLNLGPTTAIADSTATRVAQIQVPNANATFTALIAARSAITSASHTYDSTLVNLYLLAVTRVAGANAVGALELITAAALPIATTSGGRTITTTLALASVSGGTTAVNTINVTVDNVGSTASTTECQLTVIAVEGLGGITMTT